MPLLYEYNQFTLSAFHTYLRIHMVELAAIYNMVHDSEVLEYINSMTIDVLNDNRNYITIAKQT